MSIITMIDQDDVKTLTSESWAIVNVRNIRIGTQTLRRRKAPQLYQDLIDFVIIS